MITPQQALDLLIQLEVSHVVWVPDSFFGRWEKAIEKSSVRLVRVCREGEAWPLAAGLYAGGAKPLVVMQSTGFFESGDAMRNVAYDLQVPLYAWIGIRNWLNTESTDSARRFSLPVISAWQLDLVWVHSPAEIPNLVTHFRRCQAENRPGLALFAEGAG